MRRCRSRRRGPIRLDRRRRHPPGFVPRHEHDEAVAVIDHQPPVRRLVPGRCRTQHIRRAIQRQIHLPLTQAQHRAQRRIEPTEMRRQIFRRLGQLLARILLGFARVMPRLACAQQDCRHRLGRIIAVEAPVPFRHQRFGRNKLRIALGVDLGQIVIPARRPAQPADPGIVFDAVQVGIADLAVLPHQFHRARAAVGRIRLDAEQGRPVGRVHFRSRARRLERRVVGVDQEARSRVHVARNLCPRHRSRHQVARRIAGEDLAIIEARLPVGEARIVEIGDVALGVAVQEIGRRYALHAERLLPLREVGRAGQAVIFLHHAHLVRAAIMDRIGAALVDDHWALHGAVHRLGDRQHERPDLHVQPHACRLQRQGFSVEAIMRSVRLHRQFIDIDQIGPVDRVGPSEMLVMSQHRIRDTGERRAGEIPPRARMNDQFVPRHRPLPRLVRIGHNSGEAVGGSFGRDDERVGAVHIALAP